MSYRKSDRTEYLDDQEWFLRQLRHLEQGDIAELRQVVQKFEAQPVFYAQLLKRELRALAPDDRIRVRIAVSTGIGKVLRAARSSVSGMTPRARCNRVPRAQIVE